MPDINFFLHYPLSSICMKQPHLRRFLIVSQIFTSELVLLAMIGAVMNIFDSPQRTNNAGFTNYEPKQLLPGFIAWILTQIFTIPIFYLNATTLKSKTRVGYITIPICLLFITLSVASIIIMTIKYCYEYTQYWIISFLIFFFIDLFIFHVIYSIIASKCIKPDERDLTIKEIYTSKNSMKNNSTYLQESPSIIVQEENKNHESYYDIINEE